MKKQTVTLTTTKTPYLIVRMFSEDGFAGSNAIVIRLSDPNVQTLKNAAQLASSFDRKSYFDRIQFSNIVGNGMEIDIEKEVFMADWIEDIGNSENYYLSGTKTDIEKFIKKYDGNCPDSVSVYAGGSIDFSFACDASDYETSSFISERTNLLKALS